MRICISRFQARFCVAMAPLALLGLSLFLLGARAAPAPGQDTDRAALIRQAKDPDALVRWRAVAALQWMSDPAINDVLLTALQDPDARVRKTAARALGWSGDRRAIIPLVTLLQDPDRKVAGAAAEALGGFPDPGVTAALIAARMEHRPVPYDDLRNAITSQGAVAIDPLVKLLKEKDPSLREWAVELLGRIQDPRVVPLLIGALKDANEYVRSRAGSALAFQNDPRAVQALIAAYRAEKDEMRRESLLINLSRRHSPEALAVTIEALRTGRSQHAAAMVLENWGPAGYD